MNTIAVHGPPISLMSIKFSKGFGQQFFNPKLFSSKRSPLIFKCCSTKNEESRKFHTGISALKTDIPCDGGTIFSTMAFYILTLHVPLSFGGLAAVATLLHQQVLEPQTEALSLLGVEILELVGFFLLLKLPGKPQYKLLDFFQINELAEERNWLLASVLGFLFLILLALLTSTIADQFLGQKEGFVKEAYNVGKYDLLLTRTTWSCAFRTTISFLGITMSEFYNIPYFDGEDTDSDDSNDDVDTQPIDEDDDFDIAVAAIVLLGPFADMHRINWVHRTPCRTSALTGQQWVAELINGHHTRIFENIRMDVRTFLQLCTLLRDHGVIKEHPNRKVSIEEGLAIAIVCMSHDQRQRVLAERFQHSLETINRHIRRSIKGLVRLAPFIIRQRNVYDVHLRIQTSTRFYPWFKDCIGAVDGTHVSAYCPIDEQDAFRNRKGLITQNVLGACDLDMRFVYIKAGWEGSAHDARVLRSALHGPDATFPVPPEGKYYLVDSAYRHIPGFMAPFKTPSNNRGRRSGAEKLFNQRHSALRNVIERSFGVLKRRFPILRGPMQNYMISQQRNMVVACCVLHNFIRDQLPNDSYFMEETMAQVMIDSQGTGSSHLLLQEIDMSSAGISDWHDVRQAISDHMWENRHYV